MEDLFLSVGSGLYAGIPSRPPSPGEVDFFKPPSSPEWRTSNPPMFGEDSNSGSFHTMFGTSPSSTNPATSTLFGGLLGGSFNSILHGAGAKVPSVPPLTGFTFPTSASPPRPSFSPFDFSAPDEQKKKFVVTRVISDSDDDAMPTRMDECGPKRDNACGLLPTTGLSLRWKLDDRGVHEASGKLESCRLSDVAPAPAGYFDIPDVFTSTEPTTTAADMKTDEPTKKWACAAPMRGAADDDSDDEGFPPVAACCLSEEAGGDGGVDEGEGARLRAKTGEFRLERRVFLWQRELGIVTCSKEEGIVEVSQRTISRRADLQHIRCHYCVNGPNLMQKRSKWLTKCRREGCNGWYCQTHYPMYAGLPGLEKSRNVLADLKALVHAPFVCRADRGECCCSPENRKCANPQSKVCLTFNKKSHKCEKVRHRVYNATQRRKNKARRGDDDDDDDDDMLHCAALEDDDTEIDCGAKRTVTFADLPMSKRPRVTNMEI